MKYQAQKFEQSVTNIAYISEEKMFLKNVKTVYRQDVLDEANIFNSHKIHTVKVKDDSSLKPKALENSASWEWRRSPLWTFERLYSISTYWLTDLATNFVVNGVDSR